jgi:hypothetical protein
MTPGRWVKVSHILSPFPPSVAAPSYYKHKAQIKKQEIILYAQVINQFKRIQTRNFGMVQKKKKLVYTHT